MHRQARQPGHGGFVQKHRTAADYAQADLAALERDIQSTGFFRNKAKSLKACCRALVEEHGGQVPRTMEALTRLGGVGRKTANVVLGNALNMNIASSWIRTWRGWRSGLA